MADPLDLLGLVELTPGALAWIAQANADFQALAQFRNLVLRQTAAETITAGQPVALDTSMSSANLRKADSNGANGLWNMLGIALNSATASQTVRVQMFGVVPLTHSNNPGTIGYLSDTAGTISTTPGATVRPVGIYLPSNEFLIIRPALSPT